MSRLVKGLRGVAIADALILSVILAETGVIKSVKTLKKRTPKRKGVIV